MPNTYAITVVAHERRTLFVPTRNAELLLQTFFHYRNQARYSLHGFAIMPEHIHILLTPQISQTIERCIQCIKGGYSHELHKEHKGEVWHSGYHEHTIRDEYDYHNQLAYIAANPTRRHLRDHIYVHTNYQDQLDPWPPRPERSLRG